MDLVPRSGIALLSCGIFTSYGIWEWFLYPRNLTFPGIVLGILLGFGLFYFLFYVLHTKTTLRFPRYLRYIIWGLVLGFGIFFLQDFLLQKKEKELEHWFRKSSQFQLTPIRKIQGRIWLYELRPWKDTGTEEPSHSILIQTYPNQKIQSLLCERESIQPRNLPQGHFAEKILRAYGGFLYTTKGCKGLGEIPLPMKIQHEVYEKLQEGKIHAEMAGVAMALVFGESSYLTESIYDISKKTGTLHLFAASGLHIGIFMGSIFLFGKYVLRLGYYSRYLFPLLVSFFYLYTLSFPVSLSRAYLFALIYVLSKITFRNIRPMDLILVSSCILLVLKKESFLSVGFLLSYLAVGGIFFLKPRLDGLFASIPFLSRAKENLTLTIAANLATYPIVYFYFEGYSYGSILSNFILVPLAGILLPILYLSVFLSFILPSFLSSILHWFWTLTDLCIRILLFLTESFSHTIAYYRVWNEKGLDLYLFAAVILSVFVLSYLLKSKNPEEKTKSKLQIFAIVYLISTLSLWLLYGYHKHTPVSTIPEEGILQISNHSFLLLDKEKMVIGGNCKYDSYQFNKTITKELCQSKKTILLEHDSCMPYARKCFSYNQDLYFEFASRYLQDWTNVFPENQSRIVAKNSVFTLQGVSYLIYKYGQDPPWLPKYLAKKMGGGYILIQNPKNLPLQKTLGSWDGWKILNLDGNGIPILQSTQDPRSFVSIQHKTQEISRSEFSH